jgi:hypothetical protein
VLAAVEAVVGKVLLTVRHPMAAVLELQEQELQELLTLVAAVVAPMELALLVLVATVEQEL